LTLTDLPAREPDLKCPSIPLAEADSSSSISNIAPENQSSQEKYMQGLILLLIQLTHFLVHLKETGNITDPADQETYQELMKLARKRVLQAQLEDA